MKTIVALTACAMCAMLLCCTDKGDDPRPIAHLDPSRIYVGESLSPGCDMGVNTSGGRTDWVEDMKGSMKMSYPSGQSWGAVFVTYGKPVDPPRPGWDCSDFDSLLVELKGENGGEYVRIGIKDKTDPDNGTETKFTVSNLDTAWSQHSFALEDFETADLTAVYVFIEFVFSGGNPQTVYFKNVKYTQNEE